jgi:hypothetical protein
MTALTRPNIAATRDVVEIAKTRTRDLRRGSADMEFRLRQAVVSIIETPAAKPFAEGTLGQPALLRLRGKSHQGHGVDWTPVPTRG